MDEHLLMMKQYSGWLSDQIRKSRGDLSTPLQRFVGWFEFHFVDHAFFRTVYLNKHRVMGEVYRSAQPSPRHLRRLAHAGFRTILNLRDQRDCVSYILEERWCRELGLQLINFPMRSRDLPRAEVIHEIKELFDTVERPVLMHCKSGADRAGFMSALYVLIHEGRPVEEALEQLSPRFGHVRHGKTGILDHFFEMYRDHRDRTGEDFFTWVDTVYKIKHVRADFQSSWWGNVLVDRILRRE